MDREALFKLLVARGLIIGYSKVLKQVYVDSDKKVVHVTKVLDEAGYGDYKVVVTGPFEALTARETPPRTGKVRPLIAGVSLGHRDITAGTLSGLAEKDGTYYIFSNAHILHPYPLSPHPPYNKGIWQPGPYDTNYDYANEQQYVVADYTTHVRIHSIYEYSTCPITRTLNTLYRLLGRSSIIITQTPNYIDAGLAALRKGVSFDMTTYAVEYGQAPPDLLKKPFIGLVFAGTSQGHAAICKLPKYWNTYFRDYRILFPSNPYSGEVSVNQVVAKDGRSSGYTWGKVIDPAASVMVGYGFDIAWFEDIIITGPEIGVKGGDSGSPTWLLK
ncbi:MAG: hypothetical protein QXJ59_01695 [Thermofilaceae archaeon]